MFSVILHFVFQDPLTGEMTLEGGALVLADQVGLNKIVNPNLLMFELLNMEIS